jgi:hypothetical protein
MDPALLSPTVTPAAGAAPGARPYSVRATFLTAFLGGAIAAVFIHGLNARLLRRWERDLPWLLAALLLALAVPVVVVALAQRPELVPALRGLASDRQMTSMSSRVVAMLLWGGLYLRMRHTHRAAEMHGDHRPGWKAGIACIAAGTAVNLAVAMVAALVFKP